MAVSVTSVSNTTNAASVLSILIIRMYYHSLKKITNELYKFALNFSIKNSAIFSKI